MGDKPSSPISASSDGISLTEITGDEVSGLGVSRTGSGAFAAACCTDTPGGSESTTSTFTGSDLATGSAFLQLMGVTPEKLQELAAQRQQPQQPAAGILAGAKGA